MMWAQIQSDDFNIKAIKRYLESNNYEQTDGYSELKDFLTSLLSIFVVDESGISLLEYLQRDWKVFTNPIRGEQIIDDFISSSAEHYNKKQIFNSNTKVVYNKEILSCVVLWEELKEKIKNSHRFTTDLSTLKSAGWEELFFDNTFLTPGMRFFRARIHYKKTDAFGVNDMGAREKGDCPAGRANPEGIPYLYLCEDFLTTLYETRVTFHDEVSIGEFRLKEKAPIHIVDLSGINITEIDVLDADVGSLAKRMLLIAAVSRDMSKPMRRQDSVVEYVPTQFICEYLQKTYSVKGIRFSSSVFPEGKNIVIFQPDLMICTNVSKYHIKGLSIDQECIGQ